MLYLWFLSCNFQNSTTNRKKAQTNKLITHCYSCTIIVLCIVQQELSIHRVRLDWSGRARWMYVTESRGGHASSTHNGQPWGPKCVCKALIWHIIPRHNVSLIFTEPERYLLHFNLLHIPVYSTRNFQLNIGMKYTAIAN